MLVCRGIDSSSHAMRGFFHNTWKLNYLMIITNIKKCTVSSIVKEPIKDDEIVPLRKNGFQSIVLF